MIPPSYVQNRCYASRGWDAGVRGVAAANGVVYQGFSLLTANRTELASRAVRTIAKRLHATVPQVVFRFAAALEIVPLTGTSNGKHLREDLAAIDLELAPEDLAAIERAGA